MAHLSHYTYNLSPNAALSNPNGSLSQKLRHYNQGCTLNGLL